jgi:hypothetical protein
MIDEQLFTTEDLEEARSPIGDRAIGDCSAHEI